MSADFCRLCGTPLRRSFCDLGMSPLSNAFLLPEQLNSRESFYPLHAFVCEQCFLVQLAEFESPEHIFSDYVYFSSYAESWLRHARDYVEMIVGRQALDASSRVIEIASNDGYLLQYFVQRGIPVLGVEPAANVARVAEEKGVRTLVRFFGTETARELVVSGQQANLIVANNVLAHVPALNDFVAGIAIALDAGGLATLEFPHLLRLIEENQFDTIYHEHFSYLSLFSVERLFRAHGLRIVDVEELPTHGGSLRIYATHERRAESLPSSTRLEDLRRHELAAGVDCVELYTAFADRVAATKRRLLEFLIRARDEGKRIAAYGAAAKGNTLLNYCGVRTDFIEYVVDRNPHKQGRFLPGTHIPVHGPERIMETRPDYVLLLPWNLRHEIMDQMSEIRGWGGKFVVPIPQFEVLE